MKNAIMHFCQLEFVSLLMILLCFITGGRVSGQSFIVAPENLAVVVNTSATPFFNCTMQYIDPGDASNWEEYVMDPDTPSQISIGSTVLSDYAGEFSVELISGAYNLIVDAFDRNSAGKYACRNQRPPIARSFAELIVLETHPQCQTIGLPPILLEGESFILLCEVTYSGRWAPRMTFYDTNYEAQLAEDVSDDTLEVDDVRYRVQVSAQDKHDGGAFSCFADFAPELNPAPGADEASNTPSYTNTHEFPILTVHYSPRFTAIRSSSGDDVDTVSVGDVLTCLSIANPVVSVYEWRSSVTSDDVISSTSTLAIPDNWQGETIDVHCSVSNRMRDDVIGHDMESLQITVESNTAPGVSPTNRDVIAIILLQLCVSVGLLMTH